MSRLEHHAQLCLALNWPRVAALVERVILLIGLAGEAPVLPRAIRNQALRLIRPAEAMLRRLLVLMAVQSPVDAPQPAQRGPRNPRKNPKPTPNLTPHFNLLEPQHSLRIGPVLPPYAAFGPRIWSLGSDWTYLPPDPAENTPDLGSLLRRIAALEAVLSAPETYGRKMAKWLARRDQKQGAHRRFPMRPGRPPGYARRDTDRIMAGALRDLNTFAWRALHRVKAAPG